jgi:hypothetical protein
MYSDDENFPEEEIDEKELLDKDLFDDDALIAFEEDMDREEDDEGLNFNHS